jgi:hypothetical protein
MNRRGRVRLRRVPASIEGGERSRSSSLPTLGRARVGFRHFLSFSRNTFRAFATFGRTTNIQ